LTLQGFARIKVRQNFKRRKSARCTHQMLFSFLIFAGAQALSIHGNAGEKA
jgi:hypothetical protein